MRVAFDARALAIPALAERGFFGQASSEVILAVVLAGEKSSVSPTLSVPDSTRPTMMRLFPDL